MEGIDPTDEDDRAFTLATKIYKITFMYMAKKACMLSNLDQENPYMHIENGKMLPLFRPYKKPTDGQSNNGVKQSLLWVHQEKW